MLCSVGLCLATLAALIMFIVGGLYTLLNAQVRTAARIEHSTKLYEEDKDTRGYP